MESWAQSSSWLGVSFKAALQIIGGLPLPSCNCAAEFFFTTTFHTVNQLGCSPLDLAFLFNVSPKTRHSRWPMHRCMKWVERQKLLNAFATYCQLRDGCLFTLLPSDQETGHLRLDQPALQLLILQPPLIKEAPES